jgi:hypothetical protein
MSIIKKALLGLSGLGLIIGFGIQSASAMPNPASVNCTKQGGKLETVNTPQGQVSYCTLPNGVRCEEWALFRNECPAPAKPVITGGYSAISVADVDVKAAANFAAGSLKAKLKSVNSAASQVVAGTNFRMNITLTNGKRYDVVVFKDLKGHQKLTSSKLLASAKSKSKKAKRH